MSNSGINNTFIQILPHDDGTDPEFWKGESISPTRPTKCFKFKYQTVIFSLLKLGSDTTLVYI